MKSLEYQPDRAFRRDYGIAGVDGNGQDELARLLSGCISRMQDTSGSMATTSRMRRPPNACAPG